MSADNATQVVISGVGVMTALGVGIDPLWEAMIAGKTGLRRIQRFDPSGFASQVAGELDDEAFSVRKVVPKSHRKATKVMCRDTELAVGAAAVAVEDAGITTAATSNDPPTIDPARVGCHIGAGLISAEMNELTTALITSAQDGEGFDLNHWGKEGMNNLSPLWLLKYLPNMLACHVTIVHDCRGPSNTITCCEAASGLSIAESRRVIQRGDADACLSGGAEDRVNPLALFRQHCTGRLAPTDGSGDLSSIVLPFSENATGTLVGEGGGILLIESNESCNSRSGTPWSTIDGIGCTQSTADSPLIADAHSLTTSINIAMAEAQCEPTDIDAIVPLGAGVALIDQAERDALTQVFGDSLQTIPMITTIPYTGNCMSGNGTIAIAVAAKALREQMIPARLGPEETVGVDGAKCESKTADLVRILVVTPSEGGQCVAMVLGRINS